MGNYIVFDLEWNQGEKKTEELQFEIVEIGAVRLNEQRQQTGTFSRLVKPQVYHEMFHITKDIIHLTMEDLKKGDPFPEVMQDFFEWCGEDPMFCTWGPLDLTELQKNMDYYDMDPLTDGPMAFLDVQKLFSQSFGDGRSRRALEAAIDQLEIPKDQPFHRAISDAIYTAEIFQRVNENTLSHVSFDHYVTPKTRHQEIHIVFEDYAKYISREFDTKEDLLADPEVMSTKCYICHKNLRRKLRWFTINGKHYYAVSNCDVHGLMKSKVRIKKATDDKVFAEKTSKFISEEDAAALKKKRDIAAKKGKGHT